MTAVDKDVFQASHASGEDYVGAAIVLARMENKREINRRLNSL